MVNVSIKAESRFVSALRAQAAAACQYPLILGSDQNVDLPVGTSVMFQGQEYRLGEPTFVVNGNDRVRQLKPIPEHPRRLLLAAGIEYSLPPDQDQFGMLRAIERQQMFTFQPGTIVALPIGTNLHNANTHLELKEVCAATLM